MTIIEVRKGDTVQINLKITNNGEPFVPQNGERIVFSVGQVGRKEFSIDAENNVVKIPHEQTNLLSLGNHKFDVRIYDAGKQLVATPIVGVFSVLEVVNGDI